MAVFHPPIPAGFATSHSPTASIQRALTSTVRRIRFDIVEAISEKLDARLHEWKPETRAQVCSLVEEIIARADQGVLDLSRSRIVEQEVLDLIDEPSTR